ncbi:MAG TPA: phosphatase domain-containing protein [Flavisolibacter sp.]|nr:phosphatase domain-containing protein [Flavisolibacter sp.]
MRLFLVKPIKNCRVYLEWNGRKIETFTEADGFFKIDWQGSMELSSGWIKVPVFAEIHGQTVSETGKIFLPYQTQYGFISDIDDTFLISHSSNMRKRLFVLFTQNARSRKPFEGVVHHYQALSKSFTNSQNPNPFFYVSSSEWNLYDYILEFTRINELPEGVFLLNQLKVFSQLLKTGQNNHQTKFTRIVRILEAYPNQRFILLGDSSQQDPYIYEAIVKHFPRQIHAVYIRDVREKNREPAGAVLQRIEAAGVPCCFFKHSSDAILHSRKIGLLSTQEAAKELSKQSEP